MKTAIAVVLGAVCVGAMARPARTPRASAAQPHCIHAAAKAAHARPIARRAAKLAVKSVARFSSVPFRPTEYPRVFVRNMPAAIPGRGQGLVYIAPGGTPPQRPVSARRSVQPTAQTLPDGTTVLLMDPDDAPMEVAHIDAGGGVTTECVEAVKARTLAKGAKK